MRVVICFSLVSIGSLILLSGGACSLILSSFLIMWVVRYDLVNVRFDWGFIGSV